MFRVWTSEITDPLSLTSHNISLAASELGAPRLQVCGLKPKTWYNFTVETRNNNSLGYQSPSSLIAQSDARWQPVKDLYLKNMTASSVTLTWSPPPGLVSDYMVSCQPQGASSASFSRVISENEISLSSIPMEVGYRCYVVARNLLNNMSGVDENVSSSSIDFTWRAQPPSAHNISILSIDAESVTVSVNSADADVMFFVLLLDAMDGNSLVKPTTPDSSNRTKFVVKKSDFVKSYACTGLVPSTRYKISDFVGSKFGISSSSVPVSSAASYFWTAPPAPSRLRLTSFTVNDATPRKVQVNIEWHAPCALEASRKSEDLSSSKCLADLTSSLTYQYKIAIAKTSELPAKCVLTAFVGLLNDYLAGFGPKKLIAARQDRSARTPS